MSQIRQAGKAVAAAGLKTCDDVPIEQLPGDATVIGAAGARKQVRFNASEILVQPRPTADVRRKWGDASFDYRPVWLPGKDNGDADGVIKVICKLSPTAPNPDTHNFRCRWRRRVGYHFGNLPIALALNRTRSPDDLQPIDNTAHDPLEYQVLPDDMCCSIVGEVYHSSQPNLGRGFFEIGTFEVDFQFRSLIQDYLKNGSGSFSLELVSVKPLRDSKGGGGELDGLETLQDEMFRGAGRNGVTLTVDQSTLEIAVNGVVNKPIFGQSEVARVNFGAHVPLVQIVPGSPTDIMVTIPNRDQNGRRVGGFKARLAALSKRQRDIIVLTVRAFQARHESSAYALLDKVARNTHLVEKELSEVVVTTSGGRGGSSSADETEVTYLLVIESLARQASEASQAILGLSSDLARAAEDRERLEEDLSSAIEFYKGLLAEMQRSDGTGKQLGMSAAAAAQVEAAQREAKAHLRNVESLRTQIEHLQRKLEDRENQLKAWMNEEAGVSATGGGVPAAELEATVNEMRKTIQDLESKCEEVALGRRNAERERDLLRKQVQEATFTSGTADQHVRELKESLRTRDGELQALRLELADYERKEHDKAKKILELSQTLENSRHTAMESHSALKTELTKVSSEREELRREKERLQQEKEALMREFAKRNLRDGSMTGSQTMGGTMAMMQTADLTATRTGMSTQWGAGGMQSSSKIGAAEVTAFSDGRSPSKMQRDLAMAQQKNRELEERCLMLESKLRKAVGNP